MPASRVPAFTSGRISGSPAVLKAWNLRACSPPPGGLRKLPGHVRPIGTASHRMAGSGSLPQIAAFSQLSRQEAQH